MGSGPILMNPSMGMSSKVPEIAFATKLMLLQAQFILMPSTGLRLESAKAQQALG
jgi:hypothetical protein